MKISTATSVFVNYPIQAAIEEIIRAGFDGIDLWCGRPHIYRHDHSLETLRGIQKNLADAQVTPVSLMPAFFRYPYSLSSPNELVRQDSIAYMKDCIDNADAIGATLVLVVPSHSLHGQTLEDARARFMDSLDDVAGCAEEKGVHLGIEMLYPRLSDYMCSSADALEVIRTLGHSHLGVVADTGHMQLSGESFESALHDLGPLLFEVHINDNDGRQQQNNVPGEGVIDFEHVGRLLQELAYKGFLTLELGWHYSFDPVPPMREALVRTRKLFPE